MFLLFAGLTYYPNGGARDLVGAFESVEDAQAADLSGNDWGNIYDVETGQTLWSWSSPSHDYLSHKVGWITPPWWERCSLCGEPNDTSHHPDCPHHPCERLDGDPDA